MRKAKRYDEDKVVEILTRTFDNNSGVNWMLKKGGDQNKKIRRLASYAFIKAFLRDGVFISSNEKGVALCYRYDKRIFSLIELIYMIRFALLSIELRRIPGVLKRESYRQGKRPQSGAYLYFWFFGVLPDGAKAAFELKNAVFSQAVRDRIPIYLETTLLRNKLVYERYGFETYHYWEDKNKNIQFWFMRWIPSTLS